MIGAAKLPKSMAPQLQEFSSSPLPMKPQISKPVKSRILTLVCVVILAALLFSIWCPQSIEISRTAPVGDFYAVVCIEREHLGIDPLGWIMTISRSVPYSVVLELRYWKTPSILYMKQTLGYEYDDVYQAKYESPKAIIDPEGSKIVLTLSNGKIESIPIVERREFRVVREPRPDEVERAKALQNSRLR